MTQEREQPKVEVFKRPVNLEVRGEWGWEEEGDPIIAEYKGVQVGVVMDGELVWNKEIYPIFVSLSDFADIPKPLYAQRIALAEKKANKIASNLK